MNYEGLKDDALTALIHLGYLGYDAEGKDKKKQQNKSNIFFI